jgi:HSP20 family protein
MTLVRRTSPFSELLSARDAMERFFDDRFLRPFWPTTDTGEGLPALDLYSTTDAVVAKVALPGVKPEDVDITIADKLVTVTGRYQEEQETTEQGYVHKELRRGSFSRSFTPPVAIKPDAAAASFKDGLLTLTMPKTEQVMPTHVKVQVT